jgi:hypothetical protein
MWSIFAPAPHGRIERNRRPASHPGLVPALDDQLIGLDAGCSRAATHSGQRTLLMVNQTRLRIKMTQEAQSAAQGYDTVTNLNYTLPGGRAKHAGQKSMWIQS